MTMCAFLRADSNARPSKPNARGRRPTIPTGQSRRRYPRRLCCETLEDRRLLAGWAYPGDGWELVGANPADPLDQVLQDRDSGLVWSVDFGFTDDGGIRSFDWGSANRGTQDLVEGGFDDWRLPTKTELEEAMSHGLANHWGVLAQPYSLWTSTKGGSGYWRVSEDGTSATSSAKNSYIPAIAVRGTRSPADYTQPGVRVFSTSLVTAESADRQWVTVALDTQPTADVTVPLRSSDESEGTVDKASLTFTPANWNVPQYVQVSSVDDFLDDGDVAYHVIAESAVSDDDNYNNIDANDVLVTNLDNDAAVLQITPTTLTTSEAGGSATFSVVLKAQPADDVYVELHSTNQDEGIVDKQLLAFTAADWSVPQVVTVWGRDDVLVDGEQPYEIVASIRSDSSAEFLAAGPISVSVINVDNDGIQRYSSGQLNLSIPDPGTITSSITIADSFAIADVNVEININHTYDADLDVYLIGPDGTKVELFSDIGIGLDNFSGTIFDDEGPRTINGASAPYTGIFRPEGRLSDLDGKNATGVWKLQVTDDTRKDRGALLNWTLIVSAVPPASSSLIADVAGRDNRAAAITLADVTPIVHAALERWQAAGATHLLLPHVEVRIADLGERTLGLASGNTIWLDDDAAGWGWFVDLTPTSDLEFVRPGNQGEQSRMDLLTVVMHELGHVFGLDHDDDGVMAETLAAGVRRTGLDHDPVDSIYDEYHNTNSDRAGDWLGEWLFDQFEATRPWAKRRR